MTQSPYTEQAEVAKLHLNKRRNGTAMFFVYSANMSVETLIIPQNIKLFIQKTSIDLETSSRTYAYRVRKQEIENNLMPLCSQYSI